MGRRSTAELHADALRWRARKPAPDADPAVIARWLGDKADLLTDLSDLTSGGAFAAEVIAALRGQAAEIRREAAEFARLAGL